MLLNRHPLFGRIQLSVHLELLAFLNSRKWTRFCTVVKFSGAFQS